MRMTFLFCLLLMLPGCEQRLDENTMPGRDQIVRLSDSEIKGLDPQKISDLSSLRIAADQFEGLTRLNARGEAEPGLAEDWVVSDDGHVWTFALRENLRFSDGASIDASIFPQILKRLREPDNAAPAKSLFDNITEIRVTGGANVQILLTAPAPSLPILLAHPAMAAIPLHRIVAAGDKWTSDRPLVTSGPYRMTSWRLNDHARLDRNINWHDRQKAVETIIWKPMDDSLSAMRLFLAGGADIAADYPASRHSWLQEQHSGVAHSVPYLGSYYYAFNTRKPPFDDHRVRTALSLAVERDWIADEVIGIGNIPAWGLLPPGLAGPENFKPIWADLPREERLFRAKKLLADAGYDADNPLEFEIRFNSSTEHRRVSVALAAMWKPLSVNASLFNSEAALHFAALRQHDFVLARSGWIADIPTADNFLMVHQAANGSGNYSGYDNPAYDELVAKALETPDPDQRNAFMRQADEILSADTPVLPLYFYVTRSLVSDRISGWEDNISNVHPSRTLRIREE